MVVVRQAVELRRLLAHVDRVVGCARRVGPGVEGRRGLEIEEHAVGGAGAADGRRGGRTGHRGDHAFFAIEQELDRAPGLARHERGDRLEDVFGLAAERAAHGHLDDPDAVVFQPEQLGDDGARGVDALACRPHGHPARAVALRHAHVRLERRMMDPRRGRRRRDDDGSRQVRPLSHLGLVLVGQVAARMDAHVVTLERLLGSEERRKRLVLHVDQRDRGVGDRPARGDHRGDAVAHEPHVLAEQRLVVGAEVLPGMDARPAEAIHGRVQVREDLDDAGQRLGAGGVDAFDGAVRDRAQQQLGVEHAGQLKVAAVDQLAGDLLGHVVDGITAAHVHQVLDQARLLLAIVISGSPAAALRAGSRRTSAGTRPGGSAPSGPRSIRPRTCTAARAAARGLWRRRRRWPRAAAARPRGRPSARSAKTWAVQVAAMMRLRHGWLSPPGMGSQGRPVNA